MEIGECHTEVELSLDNIIEEDHSMIKITEVILGKEILKECRISEVRILEVDIEVALGMKILEQVEVGLEQDSIQVTVGGMIEVAVDQGCCECNTASEYRQLVHPLKYS